MSPIIEQKCIIPVHQFGFRKHNSTIEQVNRIYSIARNDIKKDQCCTAVFIDASQAFDKVWHPGLLFKLHQIFPSNLWLLLSSYLDNRHLIRHKNEVFGLERASPVENFSYKRLMVFLKGALFTFFNFLKAR